MATVEDVKLYWQAHPLFSHELPHPGSEKFFEEFDRIKREDVERFSLGYWGFADWQDKSVLDVGCGPGWLTVQYALAGASVTSIDLTPGAVELAKNFLRFKQTSATVEEGNAEQMRFADNSFDLVVSSGVLHHTPDTPRAIRECYRVLRPGGKGKLTFYHRGFLHMRFVFPFTRLAMRMAGVRHPGADLARDGESADDFIRQYDGAENPVGVGYTTREWARLLCEARFVVEKHELHFFPKRFIPFGRVIPRLIHRLLDRWFGTMVYFELTK